MSFFYAERCSKACNECKRRKGRCEGGIPCNWCESRDIVCTVSLPSIASLIPNSSADDFNSPLAQKLVADAELINYFEIFCTHSPFCVLIGLEIHELKRSSFFKHNLIKYLACSIAAKACGNAAVSDSLMSEAIQFSSFLYDDSSVESIVGFLLMGIWHSNNMPRAKQYSEIACNMYNKLLRSKIIIPIGAYTMIQVYRNLVIGQSPSNDHVCIFILKRNQEREDKKQTLDSMAAKFLNNTGKLRGRNNEDNFMVSTIRLFVKLFGNKIIGTIRPDAVAVLLCHTTFTEEQSANILLEIDFLCSLVDKRRTMLSIPLVIFDIIKAFVYWKSGKVEKALDLVTLLVSQVPLDSFLFGTKLESEFLLLLVIFLYEQQEFKLANKVYSTAYAISSFENSSLSECIPYYRSFILQSYSLSPSFPDPLLLNASKSYTLISKLFSLVALFLPPDGAHKSIISPHGLHVWYKTLCSICPPCSSQYSLYPQAIPYPSNSGSIV